MLRRPPILTRTSTLFPYPALFRAGADISGAASPDLAGNDRRLAVEPAAGILVGRQRAHVARDRFDRLGPDRRLALDRAGDPHAVVERVILRHARTEQRRERPRLALGPQRVGIVLHARTRAEHEMAAPANIGFEDLTSVV